MEKVETGNSSRWNPTKDQITLLENLYKEGMRTPSVDQIQQITDRLRAYGHLEGKNVFYWFQNYKARQRQKQKQERIAYLKNRLLHKTSRSFYPPPSSNEVGCVDQHGNHVYVNDHLLHGNKVVIPGGGSDKPTITDHDKQLSDITTTRVSTSPCSLRSGHRDDYHVGEGINVNSDEQRTLPLFPLQPLTAGNDNGAGNSSFDPGNNDHQVACFGDDCGGRELPFINFFSCGSTRLDNNGNAV